jgi:hypothetical protein
MEEIKMITLLFIWIIGWGFACGMHYEACETIKEKNRVKDNIGLFFGRPHYIGYSISKQR